MNAPYIYLLPVRGWRGVDIKAAVELLRSTYQVVKSGLAPLNIGFIYQTAIPVTAEHMEVLGLVTWE